MSNIDLEQDDKATLEMLEMMGEIPDEIDDTDVGSDDVDALLSEFENANAAEAETMLEVDDAPELSHHTDEDDDMPLDEDDIDNMLQEISRAEPEVSTEAKAAPASVSEESDDMNMDLDDIDSIMDSMHTESIEKNDADIPNTQEIEDDLPMPTLEDLEEDLNPDDVDSVLNSIPETESAEALSEFSSDIDMPDETELSALDENETSSLGSEMELDDLDSMMNDMQAPEASPAMSVEEPGVIEDMESLDETSLDSDAEIDTDDLLASTESMHTETQEIEDNMEMPDLDDEMQAAEEPTMENNESAALDSDEEELTPNALTSEAVDIDMMTDSFDEPTPMTDIDMEAPTPMPETVPENGDDNTVNAQASDSIASMEEAIAIDQEIQEIASEVTNTAKEATLLAIATTQKAHESAEKTQKAIEATFAAAERAFEAAKNAGYTLEMEGLNTQLSNQEIEQQLESIRAKNQQLKAVNLNIKNRIAELKPE
ncbi:hypothetical protein [Thiomicrorhabdus sp.]|uniref:hypothetical protein n=1 Tax=Thiomicrorhabdus sp. TaxID=2039724 RepID=UPI00356A4017